jgi:uncharacterized protein (DUF1330 family)
LTLVAILTVRCAARDDFRAFERRAAAVMARYGGAIARAVVIPPRGGEEVFREVHVVTFPDEGALRAYQADPELKAAAHLREASVVATELMIGEDGPDYGAAQ